MAQLHFVSGKGGVGKSVVSCALATAFSKKGYRTLLVQLHAKDAHGPLLRTTVTSEIKPHGNGLFLLNVDPEIARREYLKLSLKFDRVVDLLLDNRFVSRLLRFIPALAEVNLMGKVWFEAENGDDGVPWDRIVVDCPATGHALALFRVSEVVRSAIRKGPLAAQAKDMASVFSNRARSHLHLVTLAEDMPVNESIEMASVVRDEGHIGLNHVILNRMLPDVLSEWSSDEAPDDSTLQSLWQQRLERESSQRDARDRLQTLDVPLLEIPYLHDEPFGPEALNQIAERLTPLLVEEGS